MNTFCPPSGLVRFSLQAVKPAAASPQLDVGGTRHDVVVHHPGGLGNRWLAHTCGMALIRDPGLTPDEQILRDRISDISEKGYYAGWLIGTEFEVWRLAKEGGTWGHGSAAELQSDLEEILAQAQGLDRWIVWRKDDADSDNEAVDLTEWRRRYDEWRVTPGWESRISR